MKLYNLLESFGISTDVRTIRTETATISEILETISCPPETRAYIFGSAHEGSSTINMGSDIDYAFVDCSMPVVCQAECISDLPYSHGLLLIADHTFPGYAKLQCIVDGKEQFKYDQNVNSQINITSLSHADFAIQADSHNRQCLTFKYKDDKYCVGIANHQVTDKQGPALQVKGPAQSRSADFVAAFECDTWPSLATEWLTRRRKYDWPSNDLIQKMKTYGFIVVRAFHPQSNEKHLQWRISFSRQERLLVMNFNMMQMKCYVLLKLIKKDIINKAIGVETVTSYHCKTCMFYMLENTSNDLWIPENLLSCLLMCLRQIRLWIKNGNCPNYFIPGENMFDRISKEGLKLKLSKTLDKVINSDVESMILAITTAGIGKILEQIEIFKLTHEDIVLYPYYSKLCIEIELCNITIHLASIRNIILKEQYNSNITIFNENIRKLMNKLCQITSFPDHTKEETTAKSLIMPFLQLALLSNTAVKQLLDGDEEVRKTLESRQWDELELTGFSKLKQASILLALNDNTASLDTLLKIAQSNRFPLCSCYPFNLVYPSEAAGSTITEYAPKEAVDKLLSHTLLPCVSFLPNERMITPCAIRYEMIRRFGVPIEDMNIQNYLCWFDWGMVDGIFLTIFLLYLNHNTLGQTSDATKYVKKMIRFLNKGTMSHRETCLNLLGWIHRERRKVELAIQCFTKSLKERPMYNAANWHLLFTICGL